jgi:hypothetical protein
MATNQLMHEQVRREQWRRAFWFVALLAAAECAVWLWWASKAGRSTFGLTFNDAFGVTVFLFAGGQILIVAARALRDGYLYTTKKLVYRQEQPGAFVAIVAGLVVFGVLVLLSASRTVLIHLRSH